MNRRLVLRPLATALAAALSLSALAGCAAEKESDAAGGTRSFAADNGTITIPDDPERVVATGYAVPVLIEADADLVGISEWSRGVPMMSEEHLATYEKLPKVAGNTAAETKYEDIAKANPDLIVIGVPQPALVDLDMKRLEEIAPVVVIGPSKPDAWKTIGRAQADAAGALEGFDEAEKAYQARVAELKTKYSGTVSGLTFGHLGAYGEAAAGTFQREYAGSWGTNIAGDLGVEYPGKPTEQKGGGSDVSEHPAMEELPAKFADVDVLTYSLDVDGKNSASVQAALDSPLWKNLPAAKAGKVLPIRYTEAATYTSALMTLDNLDEQLAKLQ